MASKAREIRKHVAHIPDVWVRVWRDGEIWVGVRHHLDRRAGITEALTSAGYRCECNGEPGTSGAYIVNVIEQAA